MPHCRCSEELCGSWSSLAPLLTAREKFAAASGPDKDAAGTALGVDSDPRVYVIGGLNATGTPLSSCEKYDPNTDTWNQIASLPRPLGNCAGAFVPDYGRNEAVTLGYIYVTGGNRKRLFRYNIKQDTWKTFRLPFAVSNASLQYLDDVGGPLAQLLSDITGVNLPACTDGQTLWVVGGDNTETQVFYTELNVKGELVGEWFRGPDLPLRRSNPLVGRVFWRDAGITSFGVSNCASIAVCGGTNEGKPTKDVQLLVRVDCNWKWITRHQNETSIPNNILKLALPVSEGAFGTEQWPETLVTGGRALLFGGIPPDDFDGSTQLGQFRFVEGRLQTYPKMGSSKRTAWKITTSMPGQRVNFRALPLSQENSSDFGGRRVSRFICVGGRDVNGVLSRNQLFQLPVPGPFAVVRNR